MNRHQIRRINSYVQLSWRLKRIAGELDRNAAELNLYRGNRGGYTICRAISHKESYASSVACVAGSPVTLLLFFKSLG